MHTLPPSRQLPLKCEPTAAPLFTIDPEHPNVSWLIGYLAERGDWTTAAEICAAARKPAGDHWKRWVRTLADQSKGRIAGGQRGYKLVGSMTADEYQHYRNWMTHQAEEMRRRVIESDKVFYARKPVAAGPL